MADDAAMQHNIHEEALQRLEFCSTSAQTQQMTETSMCSSRAYLFTEVHVGKATPFSMVFPLNTFATALHEHHTYMSKEVIIDCER